MGNIALMRAFRHTPSPLAINVVDKTRMEPSDVGTQTEGESKASASASRWFASRALEPFTSEQDRGWPHQFVACDLISRHAKMSSCWSQVLVHANLSLGEECGWEEYVLGKVVVSKPALEGPAGHDLSPRYLSGS